jgi:hypothetical protein
MSRARQTILIGVLFASVLAVHPARAQSIDLTGAWTTDADQCGKVFNRTGDRITFSENSELYGDGFIIDQNRITGKTAHCTIASRKQDGEMIHLLASCASEIMFSRVQFSLKVVDSNSIIRLYPGMPDLSNNYQRCRF